MSAHAYTEDQLVEQPAIGLFAQLGWTIAFGNPHPGPLPEGEGVSGVGLFPSTAGRGVGGEGAALVAPLLGRETTSEVVLKPRLEAALRRLNPALPPEAITAAVDELTRDRSAMSRFSGQVNLKTN